jgi:SAM-dependent methyltransferase
MLSSPKPPTDYFSDRSDLYAQARPRYPKPLFAWLAGLCEGHDRAWDAACGSGQASVDLAEHFAEVQATDASESQIANARRHPKVNYSVQPVEATTFTDHSFDLVTVAQALHWFDHDAFWLEVRRVLRPGGLFAAWGYTVISIRDDIDVALECNVQQVVGPYWPDRRQLLMDHFQTIAFPFEPLETPIVEMSVNWDLDQLFAYINSWSATRRAVAERGDAFVSEAYDVVNAAWGDRRTRRKIVWDFCVLAGYL